MRRAALLLHEPRKTMFGLGLSVAILLDATVVRALRVPAVMKLMGDWNWYLPDGIARAQSRQRPRRLAGLGARSVTSRPPRRIRRGGRCNRSRWARMTDGRSRCTLCAPFHRALIPPRGISLSARSRL